MITCSLRGNLGNQMFIAATVIAHARNMRSPYAFPPYSGKRDQFPFMFPHLSQRVFAEPIELFRESHFGRYVPIKDKADLHLQGYFQSEKYFKEHREEVIAAFNIPVFETKKNVVSLHIRRGDSLKFVDKLPQPTDKYINEALEHFPNHQVLVFSDDIIWCKERFKGDRFEFDVSDGDPKKTLGRMASCEHNIIVNSTFSWWGAWLNTNPDKIVISPSKESWFGDNWKHKLSAQDIVCDSWVQIPY